MSVLDHGLYALFWASFAAGHSLLAGATLKRACGAAYRLVYNALALFHLAAVLIFGRLWLADGAVSFDRPGWLAVLQWGLVAAGLAGFAVALRGYDLGLLAGTAQLRAARNGKSLDDADEPLHISGLHRYVRHPLYAATFPVLWGFADGEFSLATAIWVSAYFWLGSLFEERRLVARYGEAYRRYRAGVPAFVPWKGRAA